ncbi:CPBP family intramembrane glutamic endopeptidase [Streptococcus suis]
MKYKNHVNDIKKEGILHLVVIPLILVIGTFLAPQILQLIFGSVIGGSTDIASLAGMIGMLITILIAPLIMAKVGGYKLETLGITKEKLVENMLKGGLGGIAALSLVATIISLTGATQISINSSTLSMAFFVGLVYFICQGTWEELMYRAYLMPHFSKKFGDIPSIILTSVIFTLGHALNPNMQFMPVLNLFIASLVFSVIYYYSGNLLLVGFGHGLWNFSQGFIFGSEVSGNVLPASLLKSTPVSGYDVISGGNFGFEGGIITTIVGLIMIVCFINMIKKRSL